MAVVQRPHRGHETNRLAAQEQLPTQGAKRCDIAEDVECLGSIAAGGRRCSDRAEGVQGVSTVDCPATGEEAGHWELYVGLLGRLKMSDYFIVMIVLQRLWKSSASC